MQSGITVSTGGGAGVIDVTGGSAELAFNDTQTLDENGWAPQKLRLEE
jgi:hypothetical protein